MEYLIFESAWINSTYCTGPPTTMVLFSNVYQTALYNYSYYFDFPLPMCGKAAFPKPTGCCYNSLSKDITVGYTSYMFNNLTDQVSIQHSAPVSANGYEYCQLSSPDGSPMYALGGYEAMYFLGNSGCVEGYFKCDLNNLYIFNNSDCSGFYETLAITPNQPVVESYFLGNVSLDIVKFEQGEITTIWQTYTPLLSFSPDFTEKIDYLILLLYVLCLISLTGTSGFYIWKVKHSKHWKYVFFCNVMLVHLTRNVFKMIITYVTLWYDITELSVIVLLSNLLKLASIFTIYVNVILVFDQFREYNTKRNQIIVFAVIVGLHFILNFFYYAGEIVGASGNETLGLQLLSYYFIPGLIWDLFGTLMLVCPPSLLMYKLSSVWKVQQHKLDTTLQTFGNTQLVKLLAAVIMLDLVVFTNAGLQIAFNVTDAFLTSDRDVALLSAIVSGIDAAVCILLVLIYEWMAQFANLIVFKGKTNPAKKIIEQNTDSSLPPTIKSPDKTLEECKIQKQNSEAQTFANFDMDKISKQ